MTIDNTTHQDHRIAFTGKGGEYFRIWIVNLALTLLTLGIYSAWAKVRRLQYFYRNTALAGGSFDYHGDPLAILKGRLIGVLMLLVYNVSTGLSTTLAVAVLIVLAAVFPWLLQRSLCFKLNNSSYRGLRFRFDGGTGDAYRVFLLWPLLGYLSLGLLTPLAHRRIKAYQHNNSRYGATPFAFDVGAGAFYNVYIKMALMLAAMLVLPAILVVGLGGIPLLAMFNDAPMPRQQQFQMIGILVMLILAFYLLAFLVIGPWFAARMQNLVWNGTSLGQHGFSSEVTARGLLVIYLTNFLGILLTLGLFKPYADIRLAKYRLEHMTLLAVGDLDGFVADQRQRVDATGEETAEVFDLDISF